MSATGNPPQLQLSLGHQTFKRSFTQFGLDVDDGEDSRSEGSSTNSSLSSLSGASSSSGGGGSGSNGLRSVSSGSSYSSQAAAEVFGYNDGERGERNKRARSEGPERDTMNVSISSASSSSAESLDTTSVISLPTSTESHLDSGISQDSLNEHNPPQHTTETIPNVNTTTGFTLPVLDFGPSTPSVAEFVALRSGTSDARMAENPPGFANMLSPRSSSPAPPPAVEFDVPMRDDGDVDVHEPFPSIGLPHVGLGPNTNNGFLDTARSDTLLDSATERLRSAMERARTFDRMLAPLRSDAADRTGRSAYSRPRLPSFDFEARRRRSSPAYGARTTSVVSFSPNTFNRPGQHLSSTAALGSSTSVSSGRLNSSPLCNSLHSSAEGGDLDSDEEEEDDIIVDRELTVEPESDDNNHLLVMDSLTRPRSRSILHNIIDSNGEVDRFDSSDRALEDRVRAINSLTDRTLDDLTSFVSTSETEDDARVPSLTDSPQLDPRLTSEGSARTNTSRAPQIQLDLGSPQLSLDSSSTTDGIYGLGPPRPMSRSGPSRNYSRNREQAEEERPEINTARFRGWPWHGLLSPSSAEMPIPGLGSLSNLATQALVSQEESPLALDPLPSRFPLRPLTSPRRNEESPDSENDRRNIGRMVEIERETNAQNSFIASQRRLSPLETNFVQSRLHSLGATQNQAARTSPARRPNLPTLRSALLGAWRTDGDRLDALTDSRRSEEVWREDQLVREPPRANSNSSVDSMSGMGLRSRVARGDHLTSRPSLLDLRSHPQEHMMRAYRDLPLSMSERRFDEGVPFHPGSIPGASQVEMSTENSHSAGSHRQAQVLPARHRDDEREVARRRQQQQFLQRWFPPIPEEFRLRDTEAATRLRGLRERNRLTLPQRSSLLSRQERPVQTQPRANRGVSISDTSDERLRLPAAPTLNAPRSAQPANNYQGSEAGSSNFSSNVPASSTEAAAFFASGPSYGSSRPLGRATSSALRRRFRLLPDSDDDAVVSNLRDEPWAEFDIGLDPSDNDWFENDLHRSPQSERNFTSPTDDLLRLLYSRLQDNDSASQRRANTQVNDLTSIGHASDNSEFADLPPLSESRVRSWNGVSTQSPRRGPVANATEDLPRRGISLRNTSRPPSLPPLHFDRLSAVPTEGGNDTGNRILGIDEPTAQRAVPWRRPITRLNQQPDSLMGNPTARIDLQRSSDAALHHAMVLRSVQARQAFRDSERRSDAVPPPGRAQGFQQAMDVLGADGLPGPLRQRFDSAFHHDLQQGRSNTTTRNEAHVRWGELADDNTTETRTTARSSPRPWLETSFRTRRRSMSALFAPPPDNADNAPPNRNRGAGPAGGNPHAQGQNAQFDWFSMIPSNRARARQRRLARYDEESAQRPAFIRFARSRNGLRNLGDFVRDEDFDTSYENLISLAQTIGEVKPRSTPAHVINALPTGLYKDWQGPGSDSRCPICLDDYKDADQLLKAEPCNHWCHKECFEQWLHTAQTCPVCRTKIKSSKRSATPPPVAGPSRLNHAESLEDISGSSDDDYSFLSSSPNRAFFESMFAERQARPF